jgi:hypothetical protein
VFLETHEEANSGELIDGGVLVEVLPGQAVGATGGWNEFDIDLDLFAGKRHRSIRFGFIGFLGRLPYELHTAHYPVQTDNVTGIPSFS